MSFNAFLSGFFNVTCSEKKKKTKQSMKAFLNHWTKTKLEMTCSIAIYSTIFQLYRGGQFSR
jgi:hypothetical protein